jgi:hypothetical protein
MARFITSKSARVGTEPVCQIIGLDRPAKPARMEGADDPIAQLDPRHPIAHGSDLARAVGKRHDAERTAAGRCLEAFIDEYIALPSAATTANRPPFLTGVTTRACSPRGG